MTLRVHRPLLILVIVVTAAVWSVGAAAHTPTPPQPRDEYLAYQLLRYRWALDEEPPLWGKTATNAAANDADVTNASRAPTFSYSSSGEGYIYYRTYLESTCETGTLACAKKFLNESPPDWRITIIKQNQGEGSFDVKWCDSSATDLDGDQCWDAERTMLHEFGHILDLDHYLTDKPANSVMYSVIPSRRNPLETGGDTHTLQRCDKARLQLTYDMRFTSSTYADCMDHVPGSGEDGLLTDLTFATSDTVLCVGDTVTLSGDLHVDTNSGYETLSGNTLGSRPVKVQRDSGGGPPFTDAVNATTSSAGNWSATFQSSVASDRMWRARFPTEDGLNEDFSSTIRIRWISGC